MSDHRYPPAVRKLNQLLTAELGSNPRYSWRWSEDLLHVMNVVDEYGSPQYVDKVVKLRRLRDSKGRYLPGSTKPIISRERQTAIRKLLPNHSNVWVCCALVETDEKDGSIHGTGNGSWIPLSSSRSGPAVLPPDQQPTQELTQCAIDAVKAEREMAAANKNYLDDDYQREQTRREKERWTRAFDCIKDACTAFYAVPGRKGAVSFGGI